jgi:hypothetical protein
MRNSLFGRRRSPVRPRGRFRSSRLQPGSSDPHPAARTRRPPASCSTAACLDSACERFLVDNSHSRSKKRTESVPNDYENTKVLREISFRAANAADMNRANVTKAGATTGDGGRKGQAGPPPAGATGLPPALLTPRRVMPAGDVGGTGGSNRLALAGGGARSSGSGTHVGGRHDDEGQEEAGPRQDGE